MANSYVSAKPVTRLPTDIEPFASGSSDAGIKWQLGISTDSPYPALYLVTEDSQMLRVDLGRFVNGLLAAESAESERWEPLVQTAFDPADYAISPLDELWGNGTYTVHRRNKAEGVAELSVHRRDRAPIRDWRHMQSIKNNVCGKDWEGIEIYPADDRLVDTSNEYWLWAFAPGSPMWDLLRHIGISDRLIMTQAELDACAPAAVQRDPEEGP
jgi:hypothetical protein